jgi:hypothetical protein
MTENETPTPAPTPNFDVAKAVGMIFAANDQIAAAKKQRAEVLQILHDSGNLGPWTTTRGDYRVTKITNKNTGKVTFNFVRISKTPAKLDV